MTSATVQKFTTTEGVLRKDYGKSFRTKSIETVTGIEGILVLYNYIFYILFFIISRCMTLLLNVQEKYFMILICQTGGRQNGYNHQNGYIYIYISSHQALLFRFSWTVLVVSLSQYP